MQNRSCQVSWKELAHLVILGHHPVAIWRCQFNGDYGQHLSTPPLELSYFRHCLSRIRSLRRLPRQEDNPKVQTPAGNVLSM